ncbi:DUF4082 domain-containing protein [Congregibacter litoralis]|uniref:DUF4082 domain-containing protein n=1 Tax=Congregibacter litoralis KT71 TaxID=314285 RepID=A4A8Z6_9GAMM|nr:DUF4082 domain-containing protein [Congregibacter litoralis]EAQ97170.1 Domain protein of unknown function [Congregibacter litoralis KT71]EAQ97538.1 Domain protein of unknown function [Congregibacter litoralis KT71]
MMRYLAGLLFGLTSTIVAAGPIIDLTTPGAEFGSSSYTLGFEFAVSSAISVTSLGVYDSGADGLEESAQVGLWSNAGDLLTSTLVPAGTAGELDGLFRFESISPYLLSAGQTYVVGAYLGGAGIASSCDTGQGGACAIDPQVSVFNDRYSPFDSTFGFPTQTDNTGGVWLGANFRFEEASSVPGPGSLALVGLGLLVMGLRREA